MIASCISEVIWLKRCPAEVSKRWLFCPMAAWN